MNSTALPDPQNAARILQDVTGAIAASQAALIKGSLQELENCIERQRGLCRKLQFVLRTNSGASTGENDGPKRRELKAVALQARDQNRVFSAVLRRVRRNLEIMRNISAGSSLEYNIPKKVGPGVSRRTECRTY